MEKGRNGRRHLLLSGEAEMVAVAPSRETLKTSERGKALLSGEKRKFIALHLRPEDEAEAHASGDAFVKRMRLLWCVQQGKKSITWLSFFWVTSCATPRSRKSSARRCRRRRRPHRQCRHCRRRHRRSVPSRENLLPCLTREVIASVSSSKDFSHTFPKRDSRRSSSALPHTSSSASPQCCLPNTAHRSAAPPLSFFFCRAAAELRGVGRRHRLLHLFFDDRSEQVPLL